MKTHKKFLWIPVIGTLIFTSCVNNEFDLNKEVDKNITILRNISIPVGDIGTKTLDEILDIDHSKNILAQNENGDYSIALSGNKVSYQVQAPEFNIDSESIVVEPLVIKFPTSSFKYSGSALVNETITYSTVAGSTIDTQMNIDITSDISSEIVDVRCLDVDADLRIDFSVNVGKVYMKSGFQLIFPENLTFTKSGNSTDYDVTNGHVVTLNKDVAFSKETPLYIDLKLDVIDVPQGSIADGKLTIDQEVNIKGDMFVNTSDFTDRPSSLLIEMNAEISDIAIQSIEAKVNIQHDIENQTLQLSGIPTFLKGGNIVLDFYNPTILFNVTNSTPVPFELQARLSSVIDDEIVSLNPFGSADAALHLSAKSGRKAYMISRRPVVTNSSATNIVIPDLGQLIRQIPDNITLSDISLSSIYDEFVTITSDEEFNVEAEYGINAPLAFGEDLKLEFEYTFDNLGLVFDADLKKASVSMDFINSIPLSFSLKVVPLDTNGSLVEGMNLNADNVVSAGTHLSPTTSTIKIGIENISERFVMDALRFTFSATSSPDFAGVSLNKNQGLQIENISFSLPDGIEVNLALPDDNE